MNDTADGECKETGISQNKATASLAHLTYTHPRTPTNIYWLGCYEKLGGNYVIRTTILFFHDLKYIIPFLLRIEIAGIFKVTLFHS
jgi:hypothetical protein